MKNSPTNQPRFVCRVVRGALSIFGDTSTGEPRGPGAAHVATCEDCQQFFGACDELTLALKRDATRDWREAPANLEQNIIRAVNLSTPDSVRGSRSAHGAWLSLAGAGICAVLAVVVYQQRTVPVGVSTPADPAAVAAANALVAAVPGDLFEQMQPKAEALLQQDNPLQTEVDAVAADARTAVRFLARNFLPTAPERATSGE